jgi:hypothetical protein
MLTVDWGDHEESLLVWQAEGDLNNSALLIAIERTRQLLEEKAHVVYIMADMREIPALSPVSVQTLRLFLDQNLVNLGTMIVITTSTAVQDIFIALERISAQQLICLNSVDEAYQVIGLLKAQYPWKAEPVIEAAN